MQMKYKTHEGAMLSEISKLKAEKAVLLRELKKCNAEFRAAQALTGDSDWQAAIDATDKVIKMETCK
jgi:hypothetical protein